MSEVGCGSEVGYGHGYGYGYWNLDHAQLDVNRLHGYTHRVGVCSHKAKT